MTIEFTLTDREQVAEILSRRANEIAMFLGEYQENNHHYGSVEMALTREISRLRELAKKVIDAT